MYNHTPVLLQEAINFLQPQANQNFIDGTLGGGGYTRALLEKTQPDGKVLAIDMDTEAIANFGKPDGRTILVHGNFAQLSKIVVNHDFTDISGIVVDIGLSSFQLDHSGRGISFQKDEPLDMRFDLSYQGDDARFIVNNFDEERLTKIFREYGEDPLANKLARAIVRARAEKLIHTTGDLIEVIKPALPKPQQHRWSDTARRVFQALRIAVNHELDNLENFLPQALDLLNPGGRLVVVTFHSLEDRIVKQFFVEASRGCICPPDFPICLCGRNPRAKILTKKPIIASETEQSTNSRSMSAKLRVLEKIM